MAGQADSEHVCSSTFQLDGRQVVVTLTDPDIPADGSRVPMVPKCIWQFPKGADRRPGADTVGVIGPATFRVAGLAHPVTVTTRVDTPTVTMHIDSVTIDYSVGEPSPRFVIPHDRLRRACAEAAAIRGRWWPPGEHDMYGDGGVIITVDPVKYPDGEVEMQGVGNPTRATGRLVSDVATRRKPRANATAIQAEVEHAAQVFHTTTMRSTTQAVADALNVSESTARNRITEARRQGLIPPVKETDGRSKR